MLNTFFIALENSHWKCSVKVGVLRGFTGFVGELLCRGLFFNKITGVRLATLLRGNLWR